MPTPDFYYLETDGQVFLIQEGTQWRFPRQKSELPCRIQAVFPMPIEGYTVLFAKPRLKKHPHEWFHKDTLVGRLDIDPVVQHAVNRSLPRASSKVIIRENDKILMVKASRGYTEGIWNLPGGFIGYGEHPEESAIRECQEELGARIRITRLVGVYANTYPRTGGYMLSFIYEGRLISRRLHPHPDEIDEICWMPLKQALQRTPNPFAQKSLRDYLKKRRDM